MTIYRSAYDTTVGKGFNTAKIKNSILETIIKESIYEFTYDLASLNLKDNVLPMFIASKSDSEANIPFFIHPLIVSLEPIKQKETMVCMDIRSFASYNKNSQDTNDALLVRNKMELDLARIRTVLNMVWITERPMNLRDISSVPTAVFSSWISETIAKRFALDPKDQLVIQIIACIYYNTLFSDHNTFSEEEKVRTIGSIIKITRAPSKLVLEIFEKVTEMPNIKEFCKNIRDIGENTRLQDFNEGVLVSLLITSWFGTNSKEMLAVALEHPPTWIAIVYSSFVERTYKNSGIAKISQRYAQGKGETDFVRSLVALIKSNS